MYHSFEELDVWKRSCRLAVSIYKTLADCRDYGLKSQMERAAVSIASNIAEGAERGQNDFRRFLRIARGSSAELRTQMYIASKIGTIERAKMREFVAELKQISKMLTALANSLSENSEPLTPSPSPPRGEGSIRIGSKSFDARGVEPTN